MHSTKGLLTKVSGALKASDNSYLIKSNNLNNQFNSSINIALNAIGKNTYGDYYSSFQILHSTTVPNQTLVVTPGVYCDAKDGWVAEFRLNGEIKCSRTYHYKYSSSVSYEKGNAVGAWGNITHSRIYKYNLIY